MCIVCCEFRRVWDEDRRGKSHNMDYAHFGIVSLLGKPAWTTYPLSGEWSVAPFATGVWSPAGGVRPPITRTSLAPTRTARSKLPAGAPTAARRQPSSTLCCSAPGFGAAEDGADGRRRKRTEGAGRTP